MELNRDEVFLVRKLLEQITKRPIREKHPDRLEVVFDLNVVEIIALPTLLRRIEEAQIAQTKAKMQFLLWMEERKSQANEDPIFGGFRGGSHSAAMEYMNEAQEAADNEMVRAHQGRMQKMTEGQIDPLVDRQMKEAHEKLAESHREIRRLRDALKNISVAIEEDAEDTIWYSSAQTVCEYIEEVLTKKDTHA